MNTWVITVSFSHPWHIIIPSVVKVKAFDDDIVVPDDDALPSWHSISGSGAVAVSAEINTVIIVEVDQVKAHGLVQYFPES